MSNDREGLERRRTRRLRESQIPREFAGFHNMSHHQGPEFNQGRNNATTFEIYGGHEGTVSSPDLHHYRRNSSPPPPVPTVSPVPAISSSLSGPLGDLAPYGHEYVDDEEDDRPSSPHQVSQGPHHVHNHAALHVPSSAQHQGGQQLYETVGGDVSPLSEHANSPIDWEEEARQVRRGNRNSQWLVDDVDRRAEAQRSLRDGSTSRAHGQGDASHHLVPLREEHPLLPPQPGLLQPPHALLPHRSDSNLQASYAHPQHGGFYSEQHLVGQHGGYPQQHGGQHGHQHAQQNHWAPVHRLPGMPEGQTTAFLSPFSVPISTFVPFQTEKFLLAADPHQPVPRDRLRDRLFRHRVFNRRRNEAQPAQHGQQQMQHQNTNAFSEPPHPSQQETRKRFWRR